jgi:hypothetical protein
MEPSGSSGAVWPDPGKEQASTAAHHPDPPAQMRDGDRLGAMDNPGGSGEVRSRSEQSAVDTHDAYDAAATAGQVTHYAGLVYMLNLIMRIDLPEILWCCGIDERLFLFDLCRELCGPEAEDDPILAAISGIEALRENYKTTAVLGWALCEIVQKVDKRLQRLLTHASQQRSRGEYSDAMSRISSCHEVSWQHLVRTAARMLAAAFLDLVHANESRTIKAYLCLCGLVSAGSEEIDIRLPMETIDIDIRRLALDNNLGYLPWSNRSLRIVFE